MEPTEPKVEKPQGLETPPIKKTKGKYLLFVLTAVLSLAIFVLLNANIKATPTPSDGSATDSVPNRLNMHINKDLIPKEILDTKIILATQDDKVYTTKPLSSEKNLILEGSDSFEISNDKTRMAFVKSGKIYILDFQTGETVIIGTDSFPRGLAAWSPDDKYIVVDAGPKHPSFVVYSVETGMESCVLSGWPFWVSNSEAFTDYYSDDGRVEGIKRIDIATCVSEVFLSSTDVETFSAFTLQGNELIVGRQAESGDYTYERYDVDTKIGEPYPSYEEDREREVEGLKALFTGKMIHAYAIEHEKVKGWKLVQVYRDLGLFGREVYVVGPDGTIIFVADNVIADWF